MNTPCPHCSAGIEIDAATVAELQGQSHFACPACQGDVPVPALERPRVKLNTAPGSRTADSERPAQGLHKIASASRKTNRNLLILGSTALLMLGGLGFFLATQNGDIFNSEHSVNNQIIHNHYFTQLIASGATTERDLEAVTDIRPYEGGFIGISKESVSWDQAQALAKRAGTSILAVDINPGNSGRPLLEWLSTSFPAHITSPVWVREGDAARVLDGPDVLAVTTLDRQRRVFLHWSAGIAAPGSTEDPSAVALLASKPSLAFTGSLAGTIWLVRDSLGDRDYFEFAPGGVLNYESKRGYRPNGKWRHEGATVSIEINDGFAKLSATLSGRQMRGDGNSPSGGRWTWEATPR